MKNSSILILVSFLTTTLGSINLLSQENSAKWEFGLQGGVNILRIAKIKSNSTPIFDISHTTQSSSRSRLGYSFSGVAKYSFNQNIKFITGLGIQHTKASATRRSTKTNSNVIGSVISILLGGGPIASERTTRLDTINFDYLMINFPLAMRWEIISQENNNSNFGFFIDFGVNFNLPISSNSDYAMRYTSTDERENYRQSGKLEIERTAFFYSLGATLGKNSTIEWRWQRMNTKKDSNLYRSSLRTMAFTRYF